MLKNTVTDILKKELGLDSVPLMTPKYAHFGDIAVNVRQLQAHDPSITAEGLAAKLRNHDVFEKIDVAGNFVNIFVSDTFLLDALGKSDGEKSLALSGKKYVVEFAHPNTHKIFHIGHLRNITVGESLSRILSASAAEVIRVNYQGDVGLHIAKCLYRIQKILEEGMTLENLRAMGLSEKISLLGKAYTEGNSAYENDADAKEAIHVINRQIYERDPAIEPLWKETRQWSLDYFDMIYERVHTHFDRLFFESEVADRGLAVANKALADGILVKNEGAIILDGSQHGVDTRVFINSLGLPTYEGKELGLAELEFSEFGNIDRCIHVVGPEQKSFFQTTFKVEELIDPDKYKGKQFHYAYGFVDLKDGKMSSRKGNVMAGVDLLNDAKVRIQEEYKVDETVAEVLAIGAVKYSFLKVEAQKNISFDLKESISIQGNSGPYLQYTYARIQSLFNFREVPALPGRNFNANLITITEEDKLVLRILPRFQEAIEEAALSYSPHAICTYLYQVAQLFNGLYEKQPILKAQNNDQTAFRLELAAGVAKTLKDGLDLLGIETLNKI